MLDREKDSVRTIVDVFKQQTINMIVIGKKPIAM